MLIANGSWLPANGYKATTRIGGIFCPDNDIIDNCYIDPRDWGDGGFCNSTKISLVEMGPKKIAKYPHRRTAHGKAGPAKLK